ncbi:hypothetical protein [Cohnella caldifontis]|uniref:hypothetical protein n=1 Tax=Cohnella caldifontis TaxID=3027471 RepID=UPI0023EB2CE5|nr:hypothetical protein [Cohnella sp. YIM B05605]
MSMESSTAAIISASQWFSAFVMILYGLLLLLGVYSLYMFIKLASLAIQALDIYLDEKRNRRL